MWISNIAINFTTSIVSCLAGVMNPEKSSSSSKNDKYNNSVEITNRNDESEGAQQEVDLIIHTNPTGRSTRTESLNEEAKALETVPENHARKNPASVKLLRMPGIANQVLRFLDYEMFLQLRKRMKMKSWK